jgi:hypothetical protein
MPCDPKVSKINIYRKPNVMTMLLFAKRQYIVLKFTWSSVLSFNWQSYVETSIQHRLNDPSIVLSTFYSRSATYIHAPLPDRSFTLIFL